jgi:hypothetical protein
MTETVCDGMCVTAGDVGLGWGEGCNPSDIAYPDPGCSLHGSPTGCECGHPDFCNSTSHPNEHDPDGTTQCEQCKGIYVLPPGSTPLETTSDRTHVVFLFKRDLNVLCIHHCSDGFEQRQVRPHNGKAPYTLAELEAMG